MQGSTAHSGCSTHIKGMGSWLLQMESLSQGISPLVIGPHWVGALGQHCADSISSINTRERSCCSGLSLPITGTQKGRDRGVVRDRGFRKMKSPFGDGVDFICFLVSHSPEPSIDRWFYLSCLKESLLPGVLNTHTTHTVFSILSAFRVTHVHYIMCI